MTDRHRTRASISLIVVIGLVVTSPWALAAQERKASAPAQPAYDATREVTLRGTVHDVKESVLASRSNTAQRIVLETADGPVTVELAPSSFLKARDFSCARGEAIELVGSRVPEGGEDVVLARELRKDGAVLQLRDESGRPAWRQPLRQVRFLHAGAE